MKKISILFRGQPHGPFTIDEIRKKLTSGEVGLFDLLEIDGQRVTVQKILTDEPDFHPPLSISPKRGFIESELPRGSRRSIDEKNSHQGERPTNKPIFCRFCGKPIIPTSVICPGCGSSTGLVPSYGPLNLLPEVPSGPPKSRLVYILLALFLGFFGIHNFYAGYTGKALAQLLITLLLGWLILPLLAVAIWGLVEVCTVTIDSRGQKFS